MNQEEILRALGTCADVDIRHCDACPLAVVPGCMNELLMEARNLILSLLEEKKAGDMENQKPEPWTRQRVLREAEKCVCGHREQDYGTPEDSFQKIGNFWTAYLNYAAKIDAEDVASMMALLKIARISENPQHMDSWVDLAGYAACGAEIACRGGAV